MEHSVKVVIGANYGDEGKGLMSRYFTKQYVESGITPVTVFHNGSAQRGHTADYEDGSRHVFHNFCAGAKDGGVTFYADTFLVHPMDFCREVAVLGFVPETYCSPKCIVVTPYDMMADHIIEDYIAVQNGGREYGSCGYGTWSATDRIKERPDLAYTISGMVKGDYDKICESLLEWVKSRLKKFSVNLELVPQWKRYFEVYSPSLSNMRMHFKSDFTFFTRSVKFCTFDEMWMQNKAIIFEGAQGLMLDKDLDSIWTTTSNTGLRNPYNMLKDRSDFIAEVCYVSRSYVTRHGVGPLKSEVGKSTLGENIVDMTNIFNAFQGKLRYAQLSKRDLRNQIENDFRIADPYRFERTIAFTHCNEHDTGGGNYRSCSPTEVIRVNG